MSRQLEHACGLNSKWRNTESGEMLDDMNDLVVLIEVDEIEGKEHTQGVNSLRRHYPEPLIELELQLSDESFEACEDGIGRSHPQAEKAFASLVIYAVGSSIHHFYSGCKTAVRPLSGFFFPVKAPR